MTIREDRTLMREDRAQKRIKHYLNCVPCRLRRQAADLSAPNVRFLTGTSLQDLLSKLGGFELADPHNDFPPNGRH